MGVCLCRDCGHLMPHALLIVSCDFMTKEANGILFTAFPSIGSNEADMVSMYDGVILS